jgi:ribosomal protein S18 acetylase RimI-like enzyme
MLQFARRRAPAARSVFSPGKAVMTSAHRIEALTPATAPAHLPALIAVLQDAVDSGASVGFLPPLTAAEAAAYWRTVIDALADGSRRLFVAHHAMLGVAGTVQLELAMRPNGLHRAEVAKLLVHRAARRQGLGRALMQALEAEACRLGRTTLVLDTRAGDPSEQLYRSLGYVRAGEIPQYARSASGRLDTTVFYYKLLAG